MRILLIRTGNTRQVLRKTFGTREWVDYRNNAASIRDALKELGHAVKVIPDGRRLTRRLAWWRPEMAWICSGGIQGRDPACHLPSTLESLGVPYVGATPLAAGLADDKITAKALVSAAGIQTPRAVSVEPNMPLPDFDLAFPVVVKPKHGLCSCGIFKVENRQELRDAVAELQSRYRTAVLLEEYIEGEDLSVPVLQQGALVTLPPLRRQFRWDVERPEANWRRPHGASQMLEGPASIAALNSVEIGNLSQAAIRACSVLGIRHFARVDFRYDGSAFYFLEANHKPDLRRVSLFAVSAASIGITYRQLIQSILEEAVREQQPTATSGCSVSLGQRKSFMEKRRVA
jgi:D-alanine-D-alanine ligase